MVWIVVVIVSTIILCLIWLTIEYKRDFSNDREIVDAYFSKKRKRKIFKKVGK